MTDITPEAVAHGVRWIQERIVAWSMGVALFSLIISAVAGTLSAANIFYSSQDINEQNRVINEWMDDVNELHQLYNVQYNQLRAGVCPREEPE